jgi:hypothetical protein
MDGHPHSPLGSRGPSTLDWIMLAVSFLMIAWIVVAH